MRNESGPQCVSLVWLAPCCRPWHPSGLWARARRSDRAGAPSATARPFPGTHTARLDHMRYAMNVSSWIVPVAPDGPTRSEPVGNRASHPTGTKASRSAAADDAISPDTSTASRRAAVAAAARHLVGRARRARRRHRGRRVAPSRPPPRGRAPANWAPVHAGRLPGPEHPPLWTASTTASPPRTSPRRARRSTSRSRPRRDGVNWTQLNGVDALPDRPLVGRGREHVGPQRRAYDSTDNDFVMYYTATESHDRRPVHRHGDLVLPDGALHRHPSPPIVCQNGIATATRSSTTATTAAASTRTSSRTRPGNSWLIWKSDGNHMVRPCHHPLVHPARAPTSRRRAPPDELLHGRRAVAERHRRRSRHGRDADHRAAPPNDTTTSSTQAATRAPPPTASAGPAARRVPPPPAPTSRRRTAARHVARACPGPAAPTSTPSRRRAGSRSSSWPSPPGRARRSATSPAASDPCTWPT